MKISCVTAKLAALVAKKQRLVVVFAVLPGFNIATAFSNANCCDWRKGKHAVSHVRCNSGGKMMVVVAMVSFSKTDAYLGMPHLSFLTALLVKVGLAAFEASCVRRAG